jgi:HSP20 family molecular chaperone IbpA
VKATDIKATFEGGVLEIAVPLPVTAAAAPTKVEVTGSRREEDGESRLERRRARGKAPVPGGPCFFTRAAE